MKALWLLLLLTACTTVRPPEYSAEVVEGLMCVFPCTAPFAPLVQPAFGLIFPSGVGQ
jgi:hypothetical protein